MISKAAAKRAHTKVFDVHARLQEKLQEAEDRFNERSDDWQESEAGQLAREKLDSVQTFLDAIENAVYDFEMEFPGGFDE